MTQPAPPIAGAWRMNVLGTYFGEVVCNSLGGIYVPSGGPTPAAANAVAESVKQSWATQMIGQLHNSYKFTGVQVYSLQDPTVGGYSSSSAAGGISPTDTGGTSAIAGALAVNVRLLTGFRGRRYQGRTGLCGIDESRVSGNSLTTVSLYENAFNAFRNDLAVAGEASDGAGEVSVVLAVISEKYGLATPVTNIQVASKVGTRVRRIR